MSEEIELAAKTSAEVVTALTEASGALGPPQEFWGAIASSIHYRFYPRVIKQAQAAAQKIKQSGLPERAYSEIPDKLLKAILEGGSVEDNESMQQRWASLLANAMTENSAPVRTAFPKILSDLEPSEARLLEEITAKRQAQPKTMSVVDLRLADFACNQDMTWVALDNLERLNLIRYEVDEAINAPTHQRPTETSVRLSETPLGSDFTSGCQAPRSTLDTDQAE